jgi:hypothetical protein
MSGGAFKVRFCPTRPGRWTIVETSSNRAELQGQREGETVVAAASGLHGFWEVDQDSPGRRWYRRSDGSHQYILGGGYGTTGYKPGSKLGHYFWGKFDPAEHTAADNLGWLREIIDRDITFLPRHHGENVQDVGDRRRRAIRVRLARRPCGVVPLSVE